MQPSERVEQALEHALAEAAGPGAPPLLAGALRYAVFPGGHRIRPQIVARRRPRLRRPRSRRRRRRGGGDRTAALRLAGARRSARLRQCRPPARQALRSCRLRRADRRADRRCADRAGLRDARARLASRNAATARAADWHRRARGRLAQRHRRRPGVGIGSRRAARRLSARQDRRAVRRRDARRRGRGRGRLPNPGGRSARRSARPIRSPTIFATCCATPRNSASRSARTSGACGRTPPPQLGVGGAKAQAERAGRRRGGRDPGLSGRRGITLANPGANQRVLPQTARASRCLRCRPPPRPREPRRRRSASGCAAWRRRLIANPAFQRWAAAFPLTRRNRAKAGARRCSISAPALSIRRSSPLACGSTCLNGSPTAHAPAGRSRPNSG